MTTKRAVIWLAVSSAPQASEDKVSLPEQENAAMMWCIQNGYDVVEILRVDGYSRRESDIVAALEDFAKQGVTAYQRLRELWAQKAFDVLVAYNHSRLGRSSTLHSFVIENTIRAGASVYLLDGGWINLDGLRFQIALGNIAATADVDRLIKARRVAFDKRVEQGLPVSSQLVMSHKVVRDHNGKAMGIAVDEKKRPLFSAVAELLLEGISYREIEKQLHKRYGYYNTRLGRAYSSGRMYQVLYSPVFWGHNARGFKLKGKHDANSLWRIEPGHLIPHSVIVSYNTHEPMYADDLGQQVIAEIKRRIPTRGAQRPHHSMEFTNGVVCAECGYFMNVYNKKGLSYTQMRCFSHWRQTATRPDCSQRKPIDVATLKNYLDDVLTALIRDNLSLVDDLELPASRVLERISLVEREIHFKTNHIRQLIHDQAEAVGQSIRSIYATELAAADEQLAKLHAQLSGLQYEEAQLNHQQQNIESIRERLNVLADLDTFWERPAQEINQLILAILGDQRLYVLEGEVIGMTRAPRH